MKYLSTFSGIGGFELGIQQAYEEKMDCLRRLQSQVSDGNGDANNAMAQQLETGACECVGYSEIDKYAIQVYNKHFNHKNYGDCTKIRTEELPDFDLLVGGFPCQAFSIAGKRRGFDEARGTLFFDIARILADKKPRNFILENVKGLLSHDSGRTFTTIIRILSTMGYFVEWQVLNAKNFGVPQNRERVFIVGHLGGQPARKVFPITESIGGSNEEYGNRERILANTLKSRDYKGGGNLWADNESSQQEGDKPNDTNSIRRKPYTNGMRIRRLTPTECERLMGYQDDWTAEGTEGKISDTQRYKMCGNGVVANVVKEIAKRLLYSCG